MLVKPVKSAELGPDITAVRLDAGEISRLEGQMLTIVDAAISDPVQRKAVKDIVRREIWNFGSGWTLGFTTEQWEKNQQQGIGNPVK